MTSATPSKRPITVAVHIALVLGCALGAKAFAQTPDTDDEGDLIVEEVVVKGFRNSLGAALDIKRNSNGVVDSIVAEDIADFPDLNLAESLQRIPGIAITREAGEGREITVRGLDAQFSRVLINNAMGHSLAAGSGGARTSRSFDFNVFASELFNRIDVHKTTSAEMEEGSLGATVNLHTGRPFDYDPVTMAVNLQASYNDQSGDTAPRASGLLSFTNDNRTIGGLVSFSYAERFVNNVGAESGRWENDNFASCSACTSASEESAVYDAYHPRFPRYADKTHDQDRLGVTGTLQFAPSESTLITADVLLANIDARRTEPFMQAISLARTGSTGVQETDVSSFTLANNTLIAATMDGVDVRSENFISNWDSDFTQFALKWDQDFGDRLRMDAAYTTSESELNNRESTVIFEHYSPTDPRRLIDYANPASAVSYDYSNMLNPLISYNFDTSNPANWENSEFRDRIHFGGSGSDTFKLNFGYDLNSAIELKAGVSFKEYTFDQMTSRADRSFASADGLDGTDDNIACGISPQVTAGMGNVTTAGNVSFFLADESLIDTFRNSGCWPQADRPQDFRDISEDDTGYYLQADFDTEVAGRALRGNVGVRFVETELTSSAVTFVDGAAVPVTVNNEYDDTLPALNLAYNLTDDLVARASWAEVMSRPDLGTLSPFGSVTIFGVPAVSFGNPFIEPYRADNTDLSLEWYFDEDALLSIAYFRKDIESFPTSETVVLPWRQIGLPDALLGAQVNDLIDADFEVSRTINGGGAELDGWELQYQQRMSFLSGWMQNLGVIANYTKVDSSIDSSGLALTGQSDDSYNLTVYYEDDKFSTRLAYTYRGEFTTTNNNNPDLIRFRDETGNLDFSASYQVNDQLRITLEGINLTDEPQLDFMSPGIGRIIAEQTTGTQWLLGVNYRY